MRSVAVGRLARCRSDRETMNGRCSSQSSVSASRLPGQSSTLKHWITNGQRTFVNAAHTKI